MLAPSPKLALELVHSGPDGWHSDSSNRPPAAIYLAEPRAGNKQLSSKSLLGRETILLSATA